MNLLYLLGLALPLTTRAFSPFSRPRAKKIRPLFVAPQQLGSFEELTDEYASQQDQRRIAMYDWSTEDPIDFNDAWDFQKEIAESHFQRLGTGKSSQEDTSSSFLPSSTGVDTVILLEHEPVYTLGTASDTAFIGQTHGHVQTIRMDRGGEVTYHGPGQLVVYPILDLRSYRQDIHWYMRALEEVVLRALQKAGIDNAERQDDVTGVWVNNRKVAAIGIKAKRWITMHGLAVNVEDTSLENFGGIVPCGLEGRQVGCVNQFLGEPISMQTFAEHVMEALEEVFCVRLERIE